MGRASKQPWTREQLTWYLREKDFDTTNWFGSDGENKSKLWEVQYKGRSELRRAPYFWEVFRRHPQLGEIISSCSSPQQSHGLGSDIIIDWVKAIAPSGIGNALAFLLKFAGHTWINLGSENQKIFTRLGSILTSDGSGHCKGYMAVENPLVDLDEYLDVEVGPISQEEVTLRDLLEPYAVFYGGELRVFVVLPRCKLSQILSGAESHLKKTVDLNTLGEKSKKEGWVREFMQPRRVPMPPESLVTLFRGANPKAVLELQSKGPILRASWKHKTINAPKRTEMRLNVSRLLDLTILDKGEPISDRVFGRANDVFVDMNLLRFFREK